MNSGEYTTPTMSVVQEDLVTPPTMSVVQEDSVTPPTMSVVQEDSVAPPTMSVVQEDLVTTPTMSVVQEDSVTTPSHAEFDPSTTVEDDSDTSSDDEFDFSINESYRVRFGNLTIVNRQSVHGKLNEIVSEAQVPTLSIENQLKEHSRRLDAGGHQSEPTVEQTEVRRVVETFSDDLHYFLQAETSKSCIAEMISHLNIHRDCVESVALNINYTAKKAHEAGKEMVQIIAEFEILEILELIEEEEEEEILARTLRESMDLAFERRDSTVPALRSSVEALKRMSFNKGESDKIKCAICLNEFSTGKEVICMPCSHIFDSECIIQWLEMNHVCPICWFEMPPQQFEEN